MSEFLAEARVLIRPDTTSFRRDLEAQLAALTAKPVTVPVQIAQVGGAANQVIAENTAQLNANTAAVERNATAEQARGAATTQATIATKALTSQQALAAIAAEKLTFAQQAVAGASSEVAAAQVQFTRANAAVVASERALGAALQAKNIALIDAAAGSLRAAKAYATEAEAALLAARAEAEHARTLGSVGTAAIANSASLLGLRGAVLTAGAAFLGATVAFQAVAKSIKAASDTTEEFNKNTVVFGEASQQIKDFAETAATSLGISNLEALRAAAIFGNLFRSINIAAPAAADMSEALVRLASDLASFNNADPTDVLQNIRSGLAGEAEPLRKFGIFLTEARVQQEALTASGKKNAEQLTQQEKVQARFNIILRDSAIAQGDFQRTSEGLANQTRILKAEINDLGAQLGSVLIPALTTTVGFATDYAKAIGLAADATEDLAKKIPLIGSSAPGADSKLKSLAKSAGSLYARFVLLGPVVGGVTLALDKFGGSADDATRKVNDLAHSFPAAGRAAHDAAQEINAFKDILTSLSGLEVKQLEIQTGLTTGGRGAEEANLLAQIEEDKRLVAAAASGSKKRREALEKLKSDQDALAALQQKDAADAEARARASRDAAERAKAAQDEADRAFLDLLSGRIDDQQRRISRAADTQRLQDDIQAQNNLQALIKQQIKKIRERIKDEQTRRDAIRALRKALIDSRAEEERLREEQKRQAQEQATAILDIKIEIAETKGQVALEKKLLQEKIRRLKAQIKAAKGNKLLVAQLRLELAQTQKELEDLNKQQQDTNKAGKTLAQSQFEFLQSLQGFSANLLGNLIPGFATGGLVGNTTPTAGGDLGALKGGAQDRVSQAGAVRGAEGRTVRPIQVDTTNALLRQILRVLQGHQAGTGHPEIRHNRAVGSALMDTFGTVHGA